MKRVGPGIGVALICAAAAMEYYYMNARSLGHLLSRFFVVTGIELLLLSGLSAVFQLVIGIEYRSVSSVLVFSGTLVGGGVLATNPMWLPKLAPGLTTRREQSEPVD